MAQTSLQGKLVVITGGAGEIGAATARVLGAEGAHVVIVDRLQPDVDRVVAELTSSGAQASGLAADVISATDSSQFMAAAASLGGGRIDGVFANAGVLGAIGSIEEHDDDDFARVLAVNVTGVYLTLKHAIPHMGRGGAIVATGSTGSVFGTAGLAPYVASKHAVLGLVRSVAKEVSDRGIRVNCVCPGPVDGSMMGAIEDAFGGRAQARELFEATVPLGRYANSSEIAQMVWFLMSDRSSYITGGHFLVDGGQRA
ncbi:MAG: SDR family oxidoreductase [Actinobacteria bacterium]|uniref:Unannotated protein n=1 Tax=freshwater metagenome TaxID=449393 RepID=A0A6J7S479_9ZZZZ|nr:SDR family oxidoreductase [Actinomycetota bacterium]